MDKLKKPLLDKSQKDPDINDDLENQVADKKPTKLPAKKKEPNKGSSWGDTDTIKDYGLFYTIRFLLPLMIGDDWVSRIQLLLTVLLTLAAKVLAVIHPIVLKYIIDNLTLGISSYLLILLYFVVRLASESCNMVREVTFASISASAEVSIASRVYNHIQGLSLSFHLSRETGKIVRICSKGSQSFAQILRFGVFIIGPLFLETGLVIISIGFYFPYYFFLLILACII